jgi:hypothetical protein
MKDLSSKIVSSDLNRLKNLFAWTAGQEPPREALARLLATEADFDSRQENPCPKSFGELLRQPQPRLDLLEIAKDHAKAAGKQGGPGFPPEVWKVVYLGSIAAALARCGQRITTLSDKELQKAFHWLQEQPWVPEEIRTLATAAGRGLRFGKRPPLRLGPDSGQ